MKLVSLAIGLLSVNILAATAQAADVVRITPLGSHDGEFCAFDRAMVFEDPDGTRILYDAGRTVRGPDDPRLGKIDVVETRADAGVALAGPHLRVHVELLA